ncbi:hypothetical protein SM124_20425 [Bacillus sp. 31A1R]|uniref:Uncharacterized protein n=1 Tax=Robertmurraya mangrovi TaxID=3098077 RepID=A0ABU5J3W8_9BACI|nr:hypothetical protein [Bacillus sp. 31A1R]MDZ5474093.1 hypothetical protein [Bacillus sp. 31A1R]
MAKRNISRCSIPAKGKAILVKVRNSHTEQSRKFNLNAYDKDSDLKESLGIFLDGKPIKSDTLQPGTERIYKVDVANVKRKVSFEIIQESGGSGVSVSTKNKGPASVEISIK